MVVVTSVCGTVQSTLTCAIKSAFQACMAWVVWYYDYTDLKLYF